MNPFTSRPADSVAALGERLLIVEMRKWLGKTSPRAPFGIGDDCAVVSSTGKPMLITTDPVIYGGHFNDSMSPREAAAKLLRRNLSDIAAMGGRPIAAVLSLALPAQTSLRWLRAFYRGIAADARRFRVKIVGGDITQTAPGFLGAFLTLHGEAAAARVVTRTGARAGDAIFVTGTLGGSLLGHHCNFTPRLAEGAWLASREEIRAMMDVSDGIAKDLGSLTPPGLVPALVGAAIPISAAAKRMARRSGRAPLAHALSDGEDYELLFIVSGPSDAEEFARAWRRQFPRVQLTKLGVFVPRGELPADALRLGDYHGYEHFR
ncbi:MAG: thiamine-monophosphate kinase [Opitutae bacterium]|nr:thiamine-monophosphate kinase [Opitutae bacterium]